MEAKYRHEFKYSISYRDYIVLKPRLAAVMQKDPHVNTDGEYNIHSIYYDNYTDKALREKVDGTKKREKYRLRWYNNSTSTVMLEKKMKVNSLCMKFGSPMTQEQFERLLCGDIDWLLDSDNELMKEFYYRIGQQRMKPCVQVSYTREPYIYPLGNVRITFDSKISTSLANRDFLQKSVLIPASEELIMEVKYDEYLPAVISDILQLGNLRQNAFSKYMTCRRYG